MKRAIPAVVGWAVAVAVLYVYLYGATLTMVGGAAEEKCEQVASSFRGPHEYDWSLEVTGPSWHCVYSDDGQERQYSQSWLWPVYIWNVAVLPLFVGALAYAFIRWLLMKATSLLFGGIHGTSASGRDFAQALTSSQGLPRRDAARAQGWVRTLGGWLRGIGRALEDCWPGVWLAGGVALGVAASILLADNLITLGKASFPFDQDFFVSVAGPPVALTVGLVAFTAIRKRAEREPSRRVREAQRG